MRSITSRMVSVATLFLITWSLSCASSPLLLAPRLETRTLRISREVPGFVYEWEECTKTLLGICTRREMRKDLYDLTKPEVRDQLINMGFVAKVREKLTATNSESIQVGVR